MRTISNLESGGWLGTSGEVSQGLEGCGGFRRAEHSRLRKVEVPKVCLGGRKGAVWGHPGFVKEINEGEDRRGRGICRGGMWGASGA